MNYNITLIITLLTASLVTGCTGVRFNERERLAEPDMSFSSSPLKSEIEADVYSAREGAAGVFSGGGGGGCGCY